MTKKAKVQLLIDGQWWETKLEATTAEGLRDIQMNFSSLNLSLMFQTAAQLGREGVDPETVPKIIECACKKQLKVVQWHC